MTLRAVDEDRDCEQVVADRQLPAVKERAARYAELPGAAFATPDRAARVGIDLDRAAARAVGLAVVISPSDRHELRVRFLVAHARDGR